MRSDPRQRPDPLAEPPTRTQALLRKLTSNVSSRGNLGGFYVSGNCDAGAGQRWDLAEAPCEAKSLFVVWLGCAGEHVEPLELCLAHNHLVEGVTLWCKSCATAGHPGRPMAVIKREKI